MTEKPPVTEETKEGPEKKYRLEEWLHFTLPVCPQILSQMVGAMELLSKS